VAKGARQHAERGGAFAFAIAGVDDQNAAFLRGLCNACVNQRLAALHFFCVAGSVLFCGHAA